jgi:predicted nucleotide-binding protein
MARRPTVPPSPPPPQQKKQLTTVETQRGIERLQERIAEIESFDVASMTATHPPAITGLQVAVKNTLARIFGEDTADFRRFSGACELQWEAGFAIGGYPALSDYQEGIREKLAHSTAILREAIRLLEEEKADASGDKSAQPAQKRDLSKVFVVHGHNDAARETVARFIEKLGFEAVILHERPNKGRTIITKFREEAAGVGFAVVLMTPDDVGGVQGSDADDLHPRARQNVVFELGFFIGALGPEHVAALVKGDIERPSDFDGVVYISLDNGGWKADLTRELEAAGYPIDWNTAMRA